MARKSFYQNRLGKDEERPHTEFSLKKAAEMSPTLAQCKAVDAELVALWTRHWMKTGFLE